MDEYDELFDIQDDFEDQFADELEVLAQMEKGEDQLADISLSQTCYFTDIINIRLISLFFIREMYYLVLQMSDICEKGINTSLQYILTSPKPPTYLPY